MRRESHLKVVLLPRGRHIASFLHDEKFVQQCYLVFDKVFEAAWGLRVSQD
jgi:hypothetical protein